MSTRAVCTVCGAWVYSRFIDHSTRTYSDVEWVHGPRSTPADGHAAVPKAERR